MKNILVFATNNAHKLEEVQPMIGDTFQLITLAQLGCTEDIPETADTLEGNASLKSAYIYNTYQVDCFADDTGLEIDALGGKPGVFSARYAGEAKSGEANMQKVLEEMQGITDRNARFRTVISLRLKGKEYLFEGIVNGHIIVEKRGVQGFGYDPIFIPEGHHHTFAEMSIAQKNTLSHRYRATQKLIHFLAYSQH